MLAESSLTPWVAAWLAVATFVVIRHWRDHQGTGLVVTYVLSFGALHWMSPALGLLPWHAPADRFTEAGLHQAVWGMIAFAIGAELGLSRHEKRRGSTAGTGQAALVERKLVNVYLFIGAVGYGVIMPFVGEIPSATAIVSTASTLAVAAIGLKCWNAWQSRSWGTLAVWLGCTMALPMITVVSQGFLGYGFAAMLTVFSFVASFQRLRWFTAVLGVVMAYMGMSIYVTYMRDRNDIRSVVWAGADVTDRVTQLESTLASSEWFDPTSEDHLDRIDSRLNQNFLVGASVIFLDSGLGEFARGATLRDAVLSMVPRAMWPNKPVYAGSGDLVATYTGFSYASGTSIGIGALMECYVNFGTAGVLIGFFIIGAVIVYTDRSAGGALRRGDSDTFLRWYLPGLALLNVGGLFAEVTGTAAAALVVVLAVSQATARMKTMRASGESPAPAKIVTPPQVTS
jgi:hypothetical protein